MVRADLPRSAAGRFNPWLVAVIVSIATFMEVLDATIANVALRHIAGSLAASADESTYILTSYLAANAIIMPISGWLANVIGRKRFYMICVGLFTLSSVLCAASTSLGMMIFFRVLQGLGGGGLAPVEQSIFADSFTPAQRTIAFSIYGFTIVTAPAIGPVLGGVLTDSLSWQWIFLINLPVGLVSLVMTWFFVSDSPQTKRDRAELLAGGLRIDYLGFVLVALGFGALQIVMDRYQREDGLESPFIAWMLAVAVLSLGVLVVWEWFHPQPVMNVRLFRIRSFAICNVILFGFGFIIYGSTTLLPQLTQELLGYTATTAGLALALGGIITVFMMPLSGMITGRLVQPKYLICGALLFIACGMVWDRSLDLDMSFDDVSFSRAALAMWLPFIFIPIAAVQFIGVPPKAINDASAVLTLTRNFGGSAGISFVTNMLAQREQFHGARLAEHVTQAVVGHRDVVGLLHLAARVQRQAAMLSYLDVFTAFAVGLVMLAPLALFLPRLAKGAEIAAH